MADDKQVPSEKQANANDKKSSLPKGYKIKSSNGWLGITIVAVIATAVIFLLGAMVDHAVNLRSERDRTAINTEVIRGGFRHRGFAEDNMANSNLVEVSGVVTNVNGASFTVSGNGTTNTVQTNSDTKYINASKVSVNDTVAVAGTTSNGTYTANKIAIYNTNTQ